MSIFQQLYKSMYSTKDMARYRFQKVGKTILYIFLLSLLALIPEMVQLTQLVRTELSLAEQTVQEEIPDFTIQEGRLQAVVEEPIVKKQNDFLFVFDPNTQELPESLSKQDGLFLLQEKLLVVSGTTKETYPYSLLNDATITKADIEEFLALIRSMYPLALTVFGLLLYAFDSFIVFLGVTLLAFVGKTMAAQMKRNVNYKQAWTLTAYSFTIPTIFFMVMKLLHIIVPQAFLIFLFVALFILYATLREIPPAKEKKPM